jgi:hypothetical protein
MRLQNKAAAGRAQRPGGRRVAALPSQFEDRGGCAWPPLVAGARPRRVAAGPMAGVADLTAVTRDLIAASGQLGRLGQFLVTAVNEHQVRA